ncbi:MAG: transcriptional regulator, LuxR family-like protein [Pseudomonadota bacterium]|jgi:PAS domain S-box-containing protein
MTQEIDYRLAFELAPVGLALSRNRQMVDCNTALCEMFGHSREALLGQSFQMLYPSADEYERTGERIAPILNRAGRYADERLMKRSSGELFWCHVTGRALNPQSPHEAGIWSFEDLSAVRAARTDLTAREREVATFVIEGKTSKQMARELGISHRTVEIYRARLMRKYGAHTTADLVHRLMAG